MNELKDRIHENGMDYVLCGDYYIPEITIPKCDRPIGHYGRLRKAYLKEYRTVLYQEYLSQGKLYRYGLAKGKGRRLARCFRKI